ncbi:MAG: hypothetical protein QOH45_3022, partial [Pseudonocardiales bacterium]|nr:hypothetical protein [Pseudonocardiales bacterium]
PTAAPVTIAVRSAPYLMLTSPHAALG